MYTSRRGFSELNYSLNCDPPSGTIVDPAEVCALIAREPGMVFAKRYGDHSCPPSSSLSVSGEYDGRPVKVGFSPCAFGPDYQGSWERFLPTEAQENEVSVDRAIGPFALRDTRSSVEGLLARAPAATAGGLYVYHPWDFLSASCGGLNGSTPDPILAIRYNSEGRVVTLIGDQHTLTIEGDDVSSLIVRCSHANEVESVARSEGPLRTWVPITCGGREAFADHAPGDGPAAKGTTIVVPAGGLGQFPLVIVTSEPTSACEDAARLNTEWNA